MGQDLPAIFRFLLVHLPREQQGIEQASAQQGPQVLQVVAAHNPHFLPDSLLFQDQGRLPDHFRQIHHGGFEARKLAGQQQG
jgi:hypothetical protein